MLHEAKELERLKINARDGNLGYVYDFYFDDLKWITRYLVVDTGNWLTGRRVLISPHSINKPDYDKKELAVNLDKEQIVDSPHISEDEPISQQHQKVLADYYGWPIYWSVDPALNAMGAMEMSKEKNKEGDPHLRSIREVRNYNIEATDGNIGYVENFIIDDENWDIKYLILDTRKWMHWLPGGEYILITPGLIDKIDWAASNVYIKLDKETIKNAPVYETKKQIDNKFEYKLYEWMKEFIDDTKEHSTLLK
ncbi:MAG: PRC-barrel domain-containing protein [Bacteroidetes bacterium]|nr:PRC-barrel domain-containing protein [Bacteroidota bacterium]